MVIFKCIKYNEREKRNIVCRREYIKTFFISRNLITSNIEQKHYIYQKLFFHTVFSGDVWFIILFSSVQIPRASFFLA